MILPRRLTAGLLLAAAMLSGPQDTATASSCAAPPTVPPPPVWTLECDGAAPGTEIRMIPADGSSRSTLCLMGFIYQGSDRELYASMPGSCYLETVTAEAVTFKPRKAPVVRDSTTRILGELAFAVNDGTVDFGLIRLRRGITVVPQLCHFGGPTRTETATTATPMSAREVDLFAAQPVALPLGLADAHRLTAVGFALASALVTTEDGALIGTVVPGPASTLLGIIGPGVMTVERPARGLAAASRALRLKLSLLTADLIE